MLSELFTNWTIYTNKVRKSQPQNNLQQYRLIPF
jgi:hypothetical protein